MSMNTCFKCGDVYDTDFHMEMLDDEMVCDNCWEKFDKMKAENICPHCEGSGYADRGMTSTCAGCSGSGQEFAILPESTMEHVTDEGIRSLQRHLKSKII